MLKPDKGVDHYFSRMEKRCASMENAINQAINMIREGKNEDAIIKLMGWQFLTSELQGFFKNAANTGN